MAFGKGNRGSLAVRLRTPDRNGQTPDPDGIALRSPRLAFRHEALGPDDPLGRHYFISRILFDG
jgi:hypothetical protein